MAGLLRRSSCSSIPAGSIAARHYRSIDRVFHTAVVLCTVLNLLVLPLVPSTVPYLAYINIYNLPVDLLGTAVPSRCKRWGRERCVACWMLDVAVQPQCLIL